MFASAETEKILTDYVEKRFLVKFAPPELTRSTDLFRAGVVDSFGMVELISFLETTFTIKMSDDDMVSPLLASIEGIASLVHSKKADGAVQP